MTNIKIISNQILDPETSEIEINGVRYKDVKGLKLILAKNGHGSLTIEHGSGYLEAYQSENKDAS